MKDIGAIWQKKDDGWKMAIMGMAVCFCFQESAEQVIKEIQHALGNGEYEWRPLEEGDDMF